MKRKYSCTLAAAVSLLLMAATPQTAGALVDLIVEQNPTDPSHYPSIQSAISYANTILSNPTQTTTTFRVVVEPSPTPYAGPITLISNVPIVARETARTFISGNGTNALMSATNVANVTIRNFTFLNAAAGITVSNSTTVNIYNNIFQLGMSGTAVQVQSSPSAMIINNTFYQNGTAINTGSDILITNNIFSYNTLAISSTTPLSQLITYNDYNNNASNGIATPDVHSLPNINTVPSPADPLFVDQNNRDFHLKAGSPCHAYNAGATKAGNPSYANVFDNTSFDMGAYGGPNSDTIPLPVKNVVATGPTSTAPPFSISTGWAADLNYLVKGYKVYYGYSTRNYNGNDAIVSGATATSASPIDAGNNISLALSSLDPFSIPTYTTPSVPSVSAPEPRNQKLLLKWSEASNATGYIVYYNIGSAPTITSPFKSVGPVTSYELKELTNGEIYYVSVQAISQATYYIAVTSYITSAATGTQGVADESAYSDEQTVNIGDPFVSGLSIPVTGMPEPTNPYPNLPNNGCFIATAAYGSPNDRAVMVLREFRDRYLVTNAPGRAFVGWYYANSPAAARFITDHPALRPVARIVLAPAVAIALLFTRTSPAAQAAVLAVLIALASLVLRRHRTMRSRALTKGTIE